MPHHNCTNHSSERHSMTLNRRDFLTRLIGATSVTALSQFTLLRSLLASVSPAVLAADPRRPQFHLVPAANWMNDPNGPVYWHGNYHMFYQYNPNGAVWGDMHWGHAISPDMVHWRHLPVALAPTPDGPDSSGCFSGTSIIDGDRVVVIYTGVVSSRENEATIRDGTHSLKESQCQASSSDKDLSTWTKDPQPVIAMPPAGMDVSGFRDPVPWRHGDWWYMVVGSGIRGKGGAVLLYRSKDLRHWDYLHLLAQGAGNGKDAANPVDSGDMWECPDFFPIGDKYVLIHSAEGKAFWQAGILDPEQLVFHPERDGMLDYGSFYAPKTQLDEHQNRILWGWLPESRPLEEYRASGWAGMMSLPRVLSLNSGGMLEMRVLKDVETLRGREQSLKQTKTEKGNQEQISAMRLRDCCGEILCATALSKEAFAFSLYLVDGSQPSGRELIKVEWKPETQKLLGDGEGISVDPGKKHLELQMYVDGSVIEVFANGLYANTKRFYYSGDRAPEIRMAIAGQTAGIERLSVWQIAPISPDRLTNDNYKI